MLDYRLLEALAAVIETGGFERAAQRLNLTQSAVSQRIRQLEQRQGQPVLLRTTPPRATALGRRLNNHLQQVKQLEMGLTDAPVHEPLQLRITINADSMATWLAPALAACRLSPQMDFELVVEDQDVGLNRMRNGEVMACICAEPHAVNGGAVSPLGIMRYRILASPDFVARYRLRENADHLTQAPCLIFNQDDRLQHHFLSTLGLPAPERVHLCPSSEGFLQMALAGLGFGSLPELQARERIDDGSLVDIVPGYRFDVPLYWHYWQTESIAMTQLRQAVCCYAARVLQKPAAG